MKIANKDETNHDNVAMPNSSPSIKPAKIISTSPGSNELLVGYDCHNPENVKSHEFETMEKCEDEANMIKSTPVTVQILQKTNKYRNKGIKCSLKRTRKVSNCGAYHHTSVIYEEEFTLKPIDITEEECQVMYDTKSFKHDSNNGMTDITILINNINRISYYQQG